MPRSSQTTHHGAIALPVAASRLIEWVGDWIARGGETLGKPTHFEASDGRF